jgi:hypothetical protein
VNQPQAGTGKAQGSRLVAGLLLGLLCITAGVWLLSTSGGLPGQEFRGQERGTVAISEGETATSGPMEVSTGEPTRVAAGIGGQARVLLRCLCTSDSQPVGRATVRWTGEDRVEEVLVAGADGAATITSPALAFNQGETIQVRVSAPGFEPWTGALTPRVGAGMHFDEIRLTPRGAITVRLITRGEPVGAPVVTATPMVGGPGRRTVHPSDGGLAPIRIEGLRPGRYFSVEVSGPGLRGAEVVDVVAGWPTPTELDIPVIRLYGLEVLIGGITSDDCALLRVTDARNSMGGAGRPEWDADRSVGVATVLSLEGSKEADVHIHGPLGILLKDAHWNPGGSDTTPIALALVRTEVSLVRPSEATVDEDEWILWVRPGKQGAELPSAGEALTLLSTDSSPSTVVDLRWGPLFAAGVTVPRTEPIKFAERAVGELRLLDVPPDVTTRLSLKGRPGGGTYSLVGAPGDGDLHASLPAGAYQVVLDATPKGAPVHVHGGKVTVVSYLGLSEQATLLVRLPPLDPSNKRLEEGQVTVFHDQGKRLSPISVSAFPEEEGGVEISGLPPGEVVVQVLSPSLGTSTASLVLASGQIIEWVPEDWQSPRAMVVQVVESTGEPCSGLGLDVWLAPQGRGTKTRTATDEQGEAVAHFAGGGRLIVACSRGAWVLDVSPEQTSVQVVCADPAAGQLEVVCEGWWKDKVMTVASLSTGSGPLFAGAKPGSTPSTFLLDGNPGMAALAVKLTDGNVVFWELDSPTGVVVLDEPPPRIRLVPQTKDEEAGPQAFLTRVVSVAGVELGDTMFADVLGGPFSPGEPIVLRQAATMTITMAGLGSHGGVGWRAPQQVIGPSAGEYNMTLERLR